MEVVLLADIQGDYGSNWARIANTKGVDKIQIHDRFREQGFGPGAEELEVAGVEISPIGGASRLFFHRAANATQPMPHRLGCILEPVFFATKTEAEPEPQYQPLRAQLAGLGVTAGSAMAITVSSGQLADQNGVGDLLDDFPPAPMQPVAAIRSPSAERQKRYRERKKAAG